MVHLYSITFDEITQRVDDKRSRFRAIHFFFIDCELLWIDFVRDMNQNKRESIFVESFLVINVLQNEELVPGTYGKPYKRPKSNKTTSKDERVDGYEIKITISLSY